MASIKKGTGWLRDLPSFQDYRVDHSSVTKKMLSLGQNKSISNMTKATGLMSKKKLALNPSVDLSPWCSPIEDQGNAGSCTAQSGVGLLEYFENRAFGRNINGSRLFLYKVTRNLAHIVGDYGAYLRSTIGAMKLFGVPPEEYWPYDVGEVNTEPSNFCYSLAQNCQALSYYRLDLYGEKVEDTLRRIKEFLQAGLPSMFGFTVFSSIRSAEQDGRIPFPARNDLFEGGHAVVAIGFDDNMVTTHPSGTKTTGAFKIRNSWGTGWGEDGYGWLPYDYVLRGLADDWWSLLQNEWVDTGNFKF